MKNLILIFFIMQSFNGVALSLSDTLTSNNQALSRLLKLQPLQKEAIEIRIFKDRGITNGGEVLIMRNTGLKWEAFLYKYYYKVSKRGVENKFKKLEVIALKPKSNWTQFWNALKDNQLLSLPDDQLIEDKKRGPAEYNEFRQAVMYKKVDIMDGTGYDVELKVDGLLRYYSYRNPEAYLEHFPQVEELQSFSGILHLIRQEFSITF